MLFPTLVTIAVLIFSFVTLLFFISVIIKRNDIADIAWGVGIILVAIASYVLSAEQSILMGIVLILITLWGVRLSVRIFLRNIKKDEDPRYKVWREQWGKWFYLRSYFQVYLLQGFLMIVVGYSAIHASVYGFNYTPGLLTTLGVVVWCVGYFFEVVGDWQLDRFINSKPERGAILTTGLWKYTRHPNYFGEVSMWWGLWLMIAPLPFSFIALISPLMITFLILKVSGIPMLEKRFEGNPKFEEYKRKTNAFFPWKPRA
jgi:steroid 5-alpha reductase family enzyme